MSRRPWFTDPRTGTLPMPITVEGWTVLAVFVAALLATGLSHAALMWPLRVALGIGYLVVSFVKSDRFAG